MKVEID